MASSVQQPKKVQNPFTGGYQRLSKRLDDKRSASYISAIFSLLTLSFFGLFAIKPTLTTAVTLSRDIQDLRQLNARYEDKITNIVKAQSEYEKIRDDIPLFFETLPDNPAFTQLIVSHEQLVKNTGVELTQFKMEGLPISKSKEKGKLIPFAMSIGILGTYPEITSYVNQLLRIQRIVGIDDLLLSQNLATSEGKIKVSLKARSYYEQ